MALQINRFIPEDIIIKILLRVPAKSIGRCRCMSKQWRYLLSQPDFIKAHIDLTRNTKTHQQSLLLVESCSTLYSVTLDNAHQVFDEMPLRANKLDFANNSYCWIGGVASCDGLVLFESHCNFILLNPITHQVKHIPFYEDRSASTVYGFGYDSVNHDYKIVTLTHNFYMTHSLVTVYSVKNGAWKKLENYPYVHTFGRTHVGVFIDGYIHWLVSNEDQSKFKILSFDIAQEKFYQALLPKSVTKDIKKYSNAYDITLLGGCLCVFCSSYTGEICVWIMECGNNESWTTFTVVYREGEPCNLICMLDQEQVLMERARGCTSNLIKYNLKNRTFKDIVVDCTDSNDIYVGGTFIESLVSPYCSHETS